VGLQGQCLRIAEGVGHLQHGECGRLQLGDLRRGQLQMLGMGVGWRQSEGQRLGNDRGGVQHAGVVGSDESEGVGAGGGDVAGVREREVQDAGAVLADDEPRQRWHHREDGRRDGERAGGGDGGHVGVGIGGLHDEEVAAVEVEGEGEQGNADEAARMRFEQERAGDAADGRAWGALIGGRGGNGEGGVAAAFDVSGVGDQEFDGDVGFFAADA
jgi:hypothetical protein